MGDLVTSISMHSISRYLRPLQLEARAKLPESFYTVIYEFRNNILKLITKN
jgi:hypothetical protein